MRYVLTIMCLITVQAVYACSCAYTDTTEDVLVETSAKSSDYVIRGSVIKIDTVYYSNFDGGERVSDPTRGFARLLVTVKVHSYFKAINEVVNDTVYVETPLYSSACGYRFGLAEYIIYGDASQNTKNQNNSIVIDTNSCTRTTLNVERETELLRLFAKENVLKN